MFTSVFVEEDTKECTAVYKYDKNVSSMNTCTYMYNPNLHS